MATFKKTYYCVNNNMKATINLEKKYSYLAVFVVMVGITLISVSAFGTGGVGVPSIMGHSASEIDFLTEGINGLKLSDTGVSCNGANGGVIKYDGTEFLGCDGIAWVNLAGASVGPGMDLVNAQHSSLQCEGLGGVVVNDGNDFCRLSGNSCASYGWIQYKSWSSTSGDSCEGVRAKLGNQLCGTSCNTGNHGWSDRGLESCSYASGTTWYDSNWGGTKCSGSGGARTCSASYTEVGCY